MYNKEQILTETDFIVQQIQDLDTVKDYQQVERQIHQNDQIESKMQELKKNQKQSVNLHNYGKMNALKQSEDKISDIESIINTMPIVEEFRSLQYDANDLLQIMISTMEDELNQLNDSTNTQK